MKVKSKSGLFAVVLSLLFAVTLIAGIWFLAPAKAHAEAETGLVPFYGEELKASQSAKTGGGMVYWAPDQMRLYFKFQGVTAPAPQAAGGTQMGPDENVNKIKVTIAGVTKPVLEWKNSDGGSGWISAMEAAVDPRDPDVFELWFCDNGKGWLPQVEYVTIGAGFQWYSGDTPVDGAVVAQDYILRNDGNAGGWTKVDEIPALETGLVPVYGAVLKDSASSRTFPAGGSTVYWSSNQMRLYFKFNGVTKPDRQAQVELNVNGNAEKIELTVDGQTKPLTQYLALPTGGWLNICEGHVNGASGPADPDIFEAWICDNSAGWLQKTQYVTIKAGFQWYSGGQPVEGATVQKDYILKKDGTNWLKVDSIPQEDVALSLLSQSEITGHFEASADTTDGYHGKLGAFWSPTQMRLYFKAAGDVLPTGSNPGTNVYTNSDKIYLTDATGSKSLAEWKAEGKFSWADFAPYGSTDAGYGQIVICSDAHPEWLAGIKSVTVKAGFQWLTAVDTPAGYVTKEDFTIYNGGVDDGWLAENPDAEVPDITVTALAGDEIQNGPFYSNGEYGKGVLWDPTQMRLYFKVEGLTTTLSTKHGQHFYDNNEKIKLITADGTSATIKGWHDAGNIAWADNSKHALDAPDYLEIWINCGQSEENKAWLASITYAIIEEGFQLVDDNNVPIRGAVVKTTVYLEKDENGNWVACTEEDIPKPDTALVPTYGTPSTLWDSTQMRVFFTFEGMARPTDEMLGKVGTIYNGDKFEITDANGTTKTVAEWHADNKVGWFAPFNGAHYPSTTTAEFWISIVQGNAKEENEAWLAGIRKITIKEGFQWYTAAGPLDGAVVQADVTLWNGGEAGWLRYADSITATLNEGEVNQGDELQAHLTVKAHYGEEEEAITGYTLEGYDSTKTGEEQTVTVKYQDQQTTVTVTVKAADKELTGITLSGKTTFDVKRFEELDTTGLVVTATYSNGPEETIEAGNYTVEPFDPWTTEKTVTLKVSYTFAGETCEQNITVNVGEPDKTTGMEVGFYNVMWQGNVTLYFRFKGVTAPKIYGNACYLESFAGNHIADYLVIKLTDGTEQTYREWQAGHSDWIFSSEDISHIGKDWAKICINLSGSNGQPEQTFATIQAITIKAGFQWVGVKDGQTGSPWGVGWTAADYDKYQNWPGAIVKEDVTLWKGAENWEKYAQSIDVTTTQESLAIGEEVDLSKITLTVHYEDGTQGTVLVTKEMLDKTSFTQAGESQKITVTYQDKTNDLSFTVIGKTLTGIKIVSEPTTKEYYFGALELNLEGLAINKIFDDGNEEPLTAEELRSCEITGFDGYTVAKQTITVKYGEKSATFQVTVSELPEGRGLYAQWQAQLPFRSSLQVSGVAIDLALRQGSATTPKAVQVPKNADHFLDYVEINGKKATQYGDAISWAGFHGWEFVIALADSRLVWSDWADGKDDGSGNPACKYVEGESEVIRTVKLLKGFQFYGATDGKDHWPDTDNGAYIAKVEGSVLTEDVFLYNNNGYNWERILKQDSGANVLEGVFKPAAGALTVTTMPEKVTYKKGESLSVRGLVLTAKFEDGGVETLSVTVEDVKGFDSGKVGKQTLTVETLHGVATFEVEVVEDGQSGTTPGGDNPGGTTPGGDNPGGDNPGNEPSGDKGCGGIIGVNALLLMGGACAVVLFRRKRK